MRYMKLDHLVEAEVVEAEGEVVERGCGAHHLRNEGANSRPHQRHYSDITAVEDLHRSQKCREFGRHLTHCREEKHARRGGRPSPLVRAAHREDFQADQRDDVVHRRQQRGEGEGECREDVLVDEDHADARHKVEGQVRCVLEQHNLSPIALRCAATRFFIASRQSYV